MTVHEVAKQLHGLSVGGFFNGEKFSVRQLENYIRNMFRPDVVLKLGNRFAMEIALPDGRWFFTVNRFSDKVDGYDYVIPETREQEAKIVAALME